MLEVPQFTIRRDMIAQARAPCLDCRLQHLADRADQPLDIAGPEAGGCLSKRHQYLVAAPEFAPPKAHFHHQPGFMGRPCAGRAAFACAFIAKAIRDLPSTLDLIERLDADPVLRPLCGWSRRSAFRNEATFSRAFAEFSASDLPIQTHGALVVTALDTSIVGRVSHGVTAIEARSRWLRRPRSA